MPFSLGNMILLKEKGEWGWESQFLGRLIRSPWSPNWREGSGVLKEEIGVWNSQGGGKDKHLSIAPSPPNTTFLRLSHISPLPLKSADYTTKQFSLNSILRII